MEQILLSLLNNHYLTKVDDTSFNVILKSKVELLQILDKHPDLICAGSFIKDNVFVGAFQYLPKP